MTAAFRAEGGQNICDEYDVIVFDCDGVLLDSNDLKTRTFANVLRAHGFSDDQVAAFTDYQRRNFGTSRYRLFQAVVDGEFGAADHVTLDQLIDDFGVQCSAGYLEQPETPGLADALDRAAAGGRLLYIVSGSDEAELRSVFDQRGLSGRFTAIYGSPTTKIDNMRRVLADRPAGDRVLFIGDADADMRAAESVGADFLFMAGFSTVRDTLEPAARAADWHVIENLQEL